MEASAAANPPGGLKDALLALSLANLLFVETWAELLFDADGGYFNKLPVGWHALLALLFNLTWVAVVAWIILRAVRQTKSAWLRRLVVLAASLVLAQAANYVRVQVLGWSLGGLLRFGGLPMVGLVGLIGLGVLLRFHSLAARVEMAVLGILSPLAFLTLGRVLLVLSGVIEIRQHTEPGSAAGMLNEPQHAPKVVWVIFDEMDQRLAFTVRPEKLRLPEFDRLMGESISLTNAFPPGHCTLISMPALTTGKAVRRSRATGHSSLELTLQGEDDVVRWESLTNVFDRARALGFNTAAVGWYHPYDRVMGRSLSRVTWYPYMWFEMVRGETFLECVWNQITAISFVEHRRRLAMDYEEAMLDALPLAADPAIGVSLIHLPVPHPPGIYDGARGRHSVTQFGRLQGYLNNLRLADLALGRLREHLTAKCAWTNTWFIASSDHWWRQSRSGDHRVPFILKPPAPGKGEVFGGMVNTIVTGDLILAILRGEVTDTGSAIAWLEQRTVSEPPSYESMGTAH